MMASRSKSADLFKQSRSRSLSASRHWSSADSDDDQSSWIADDICTHCGGLAPHGKLYCSRKCRDADASDGAGHPGGSIAEEPGVSEGLSKLRYPMTLSPPVQHAASLPKLSKSKSAKAVFSLKSQNSASSLSSDEDVSKPDKTSAHARHGSRSSVSTGSDVVDTDLTTPSPWQDGIDLDEDKELSKLDDAELQLPPAMCPSSQVLLRKDISHQNGSSFKSSSLSAPHRTLNSPTLLPHSHNPRGSGFHMQFSRLPGSTNLPNPVVFSAGLSQGSCRPGHNVTKSRSSDSAKDYFCSVTSSPQMTPLDHGSEANKTERAKSFSSVQNRITNPTKQSSVCAWRQNQHKAKTEPHLPPARMTPPNQELCGCRLSQPALYVELGEKDVDSNPSRPLDHESSDIEAPVRGRALQRKNHSCGTGARRSSRASCGPCTLLCREGSKHELSGNPKDVSGLSPVPSKDRVAVLEF